MDQKTAVDIADVLFGSKTVAAEEKEEIDGGQSLEEIAQEFRHLDWWAV